MGLFELGGITYSFDLELSPLLPGGLGTRNQGPDHRRPTTQSASAGSGEGGYHGCTIHQHIIRAILWGVLTFGVILGGLSIIFMVGEWIIVSCDSLARWGFGSPGQTRDYPIMVCAMGWLRFSAFQVDPSHNIILWRTHLENFERTILRGKDAGVPSEVLPDDKYLPRIDLIWILYGS